MNVLGINAVFHESAAAITVDGQVVAACEEERFNESNTPSHRRSTTRTSFRNARSAFVRMIPNFKPRRSTRCPKLPDKGHKLRQRTR